MAQSKRIQRLDQSEPVHARCDLPRFSTKSMVGIGFGQAQSIYMDEIRLAADIDFGTVTIKIDQDHYTLSLASALLVLEKANANIEMHSKYSDVLSEGEIAAKAVEQEKTGNTLGIDVGGEAGTKSGRGATIKGMFKKESSRSAEASTTIKHRITLVTPEGQDSWRIGGPDGNPLLATKDLRGPVINSFKGDEARPLCTLKAVDPDQPVSGRLRVLASPAHFRLRSETSRRNVTEDVADALDRDQRKFASREQQNEQELRERVAAMALLKPLRLPDRDLPDEGMLDLASRAFTFVPESDTESHE